MNAVPLPPDRLVPFLILVLALGTLTGCDLVAAETGSVTLRDLESRFTFTFQGSAVSPGTPREFTSTETVDVDLNGYVREEGFSPSDVQGVTPSEARLLVNFPPDQNLGFLDRIVLRLADSDGASVQVAALDQFPANQRRVSVPVSQNRDVASLVSAPVDGLLEVTTSESLTADETYELEVELSLDVEVGGF